MHSELSTEELARDWSLNFADLDFLSTKPKVTRYVLAVQLKYFAVHGCFAYVGNDIPSEAVSYLAEQLGNKQPDLTELNFGGRSKRRHRAGILEYLGFQRLSASDRATLVAWVKADFAPQVNQWRQWLSKYFYGAVTVKSSAQPQMKLSALPALNGTAFWRVGLIGLQVGFRTKH